MVMVHELIVEAQLAARDKEINRLKDEVADLDGRITDTNVVIASVSAENKKLHEVVIDSFETCSNIGFCPELGYPVEDWCPYCRSRKALDSSYGSSE